MPIPIPAGLNFFIKHNTYQHAGNMPVMSASRDHYTIGYIISGDRKSITLSSITEQHAGQVGMVAPGTLHQTFSLSDVTYERILIKYTYKMAEPFIQLVGRPVFDHLYEEHILSFPEPAQKKICTMMLDMVDEFEHYNEYSEYILQGMLTRLLLTIMQDKIPNRNQPLIFPYKNEQIMQATYYIESNYNRNLPIDEVSKYVNLSTSYFSALFKKMLGFPFSKYLNSVRIQHALLLLSNDENTISDIAAKCGFSNANYFCDVFKSIYSISPTAYRKYYKNKINH
jgi:AraC-like DNA-binding protein